MKELPQKPDAYEQKQTPARPIFPEQPPKPRSYQKNEAAARPTFDQYKALLGEMKQDEFSAIENQQGDIKVGIKEILDLKIGFPSTEIALTYSKIRAIFPDKEKMWVLTETYQYLGKQ